MLLEQVKRTIDQHHLLKKGDRLIVGVSGGMDSMVLFHILNTLRKTFDLSLIVAHVNHGLRPEESEREAELVHQESKRFDCPFEYGQFNVKEFQKKTGLSLQDAARKIRFQFYQTLLEKYGAHKVALGHNADDQVETVLLNLFRGSGLKGLKGMLPMREGRVIRPLLEVWRDEIESFALDHGIPYLTDSSNLQRRSLRNKIRLDLIPLLEKEYSPNFKAIVNKISKILREENDCLEKKTEKIFHQMVQRGGDVLSLRVSEYRSLHPSLQRRVLERLIENLVRDRLTMEEEERWPIDSVMKKLNKPYDNFILELSQDIYLEKSYDTFMLKKGRVRRIPPFEVELTLPGRTFIKEIGQEILVEELEPGVQVKELNISSQVAFFDLGSLKFPLKVRNFRPGDRFQPLGVKGTQKLKEFFIDHKIPRFERMKVPLLISGEMIAWVMGYRISEKVKVTEKTERILKVEFIS